jgi:hypothetical protein
VPLFQIDKVTAEKQRHKGGKVLFLFFFFLFLCLKSLPHKMKKKNKPISGQWGAGARVVFNIPASLHTPRREK